MDLFPSPHPLTPPHCEEDVLAWLRLLRSRRVGISTFFRLMQDHGSAAAALDALPAIAAAAGVERYRICPLPVVEQELRAARRAGATFIAYGSAAYPTALMAIPDPPPILWAVGDLSLLQRSRAAPPGAYPVAPPVAPPVALVGARNASSLGLRMARKLAADLGAKGHVVVSGLARGIDTAAHKAALDTGTIAVLASGVDVIYPKENTALGEEIGRVGLRLSEAPMGTSPQARHFPARNRIVSGLSRAVVVVEAAVRSGSLITARCALDQGRDVLAVPGHPFDARASGCNLLLRDGAQLVRHAGDVTEALDALPDADPDIGPGFAEAETAEPGPTAPAPAAFKAGPAAGAPGQGPSQAPGHQPEETAVLHDMILTRLGPSPLAEDQLIRDLALPAAAITPALVNLEIEGRIQRQPGGMVNRLD